MADEKVKLNLGQGAWHRAISIDYADLLSKHLLIMGQTGSGKSTSAKQIINELQKNNVTNMVFDPTGEYSRDLNNRVTYKVGQNAFIDIRALSAEEITKLLGLNWNGELTAKLQSAIISLRIQSVINPYSRELYSKVNRPVSEFERSEQALTILNQNYAIELLAKQLVQEFVVPFADERSDYSVLGQELDRARIQQYWPQIQELEQLLSDDTLNRIFHFQAVESKTTQYDLPFILKTFEGKVNQKRSLIIDLSALQPYPAVQQRVLSFLMDTILLNRLASRTERPVAVFLDEAHRYIPLDQAINENGLFHLLREGRKVNLNVVISTQSLQDLPEALRGQLASNLVHRYQSTNDLSSLMLSKRFLKKLPQLPVGEALLLGNGKPSIIAVQKPESM
ncbi:ATP-binding protein [Fructobacillus durionis]|uniref:AAA+ ATPase domain-containing protein n=1 Tax=Fructobacillus durionis TaxID=283737 RepID=A0A1I1FQX5_9LACO|nr:ATP-binding protein [Fructobacillus durionis]SFB99390.1 hypothetical protein SAMN05660453_0781 [Fructobacillus durionis]